MALWTTPDTQSNYDVYTIAYLLKDALSAALSDALAFNRTVCAKPDVKGASHAEISARLGRFRDSCNGLREREALMTTKVLRAREWAYRLKRLAPELQQEADQFLEATEDFPALQPAFSKDAQRIFHGGLSHARFLDERQGPQGGGDRSTGGQNRDYLIGGLVPLLDLRVACEVFLDQIDEEFFQVRDTGDAPSVGELAFAEVVDRLKPPLF